MRNDLRCPNSPVVEGDLLLDLGREVGADPQHGVHLAAGGQPVEQEAEDLRHGVRVAPQHVLWALIS